MTETTTDLRLDKQIGGFDFDFLGFLLEKGERKFLGLGMRPNSCRVQVGARKAAALMSFPKYPTLKMSQKIQYIDHTNPFPCLYGSNSSF